MNEQSPVPPLDQFDPTGSVVLVVDDNEQNVELLQAYLEPLGIEVPSAYDGVEAMQYIQSASRLPDLILLDVMMPRMSGFEVCRQIKSNADTRHIAVLMVTALQDISDFERGLDCGTDDFLTKPVNRLELIARVRTLLRINALLQSGVQKDSTIEELRERLITARKTGIPPVGSPEEN